MKKEFLIAITCLILGNVSNAQTLKVAHKSHSGKSETFFAYSSKNFGIVEPPETYMFEMERYKALNENTLLQSKEIKPLENSKPIIQPVKILLKTSKEDKKPKKRTQKKNKSTKVSQPSTTTFQQKTNTTIASISNKRPNTTSFLWIGLLICIAMVGLLPIKR